MAERRGRGGGKAGEVAEAAEAAEAADEAVLTGRSRPQTCSVSDPGNAFSIHGRDDPFAARRSGSSGVCGRSAASETALFLTDNAAALDEIILRSSEQPQTLKRPTQ